MHGGKLTCSILAPRCPDEQLGQLYELMQAIQKQGGDPDGQSQ